MKKNYEAPAFDVITYSLQEAIAGNCIVSKYNGQASGSTECLDEGFIGISFGWTETQCTSGGGGNSGGGSNSFGDGSIYDAMRSGWVSSYSSGTDGGVAGLDAAIRGYCYFTSTETMVANS